MIFLCSGSAVISNNAQLTLTCKCQMMILIHRSRFFLVSFFFGTHGNCCLEPHNQHCFVEWFNVQVVENLCSAEAGLVTGIAISR